MRSLSTQLYSFAAPLVLFSLPLMDFSVDEVGNFVRGDEFRQFWGESLIQIFTGIMDAFLVAIFGLFAGLFGGA